MPEARRGQEKLSLTSFRRSCQQLGFWTSSLQNCALLRHSVCRYVHVAKFWPMKWEQEWCVQLLDNIFITKLFAFRVPVSRKMVTTEAVDQDAEMEATFWESWSALLAVEQSCLIALAIVKDKFLLYLKHCIFWFLCKYTLVKKWIENAGLLTEGFFWSVLFRAINLCLK